MKAKLLILLCFVPSFLQGGPLSEQLYSVKCKISVLYQNLNVETIDQIIKQIDDLVKTKEEMTEEEETEIMDLNEDGMFLKLLKKYMHEPSGENLNTLKEWEQCKPELSVLVQEATQQHR